MPQSDLQQLAVSIRNRAVQEGFPYANARGFRRFDAMVAIHLADHWPGTIGEAMMPDVWNFLSTVLLPDVAAWRWSSRSAERLYGSLYRNAFGRLWLHGRLLDRGADHDPVERWHLLLSASEDFLMNLVERPSLSSDWDFARLIGEEWVRWRELPLAGNELEPLHRSALKMLRVVSTTIETAVMSEDQIQGLIAEAFTRSFEALRQKR